MLPAMASGVPIAGKPVPLALADDRRGYAIEPDIREDERRTAHFCGGSGHTPAALKSATGAISLAAVLGGSIPMKVSATRLAAGPGSLPP
jgi:hypothetical protein